MITFEIPIRLISTANAREHWRAVAKRKKEHRALGVLYTTVRVSEAGGIKPPFDIIITRLGKRLLDDDNLSGSAKFLRDGIADALNVDDGDVSKIRFVYRQECGKIYGARIQITHRS